MEREPNRKPKRPQKNQWLWDRMQEMRLRHSTQPHPKRPGNWVVIAPKKR